jgi:pimeloyl-ACP methyl ester carboxylesterase
VSDCRIPNPGAPSDWARDVAELVDQIDIDRFAVMGWSMGGQYAAALGRALPRRVMRVAIIAGALPLTEPRVFDELPAMDRFLTRTSLRTTRLAAQWFRLMRVTAGVVPTLYGRLGARELGPADGAVIRDEGFGVFALITREALKQPQGAVEEYRNSSTASWPHRLASRIPNATLNIRDGGHFMAHLHYREIFDALAR